LLPTPRPRFCCRPRTRTHTRTLRRHHSKQLIAASTKAYKFASTHLGKYSDSVSDAGAFYRSSNMYDDIALNAVW
jgi:hypothetical protein